MKTKFILWFSALFLLLIAGVGCEKDCPSGLVGTWVLIGFGDVTGKTFREPEPRDCEKCYTISFLTNATFRGNTPTNDVVGTYTANGGVFRITNWGGTEVNEILDGPQYVEAMCKAFHYEIASEQLRLYYNEDKNYLLFKRKQPWDVLFFYRSFYLRSFFQLKHR